MTLTFCVSLFPFFVNLMFRGRCYVHAISCSASRACELSAAALRASRSEFCSPPFADQAASGCAPVKRDLRRLVVLSPYLRDSTTHKHSHPNVTHPSYQDFPPHHKLTTSHLNSRTQIPHHKIPYKTFFKTTIDQKLALLTQFLTIITNLMDNLRQHKQPIHTAQCR